MARSYGVLVAPTEYLSLKLRAHELLKHVPLYDVSTVDLPGGGSGRTIADVVALDATAPPSWIASLLYGARHFLGRVFAWDQVSMDPGDSLVARLSARDRRESEITPGSRDGAFRLVYRFREEQLSEIRNATVQGYVCLVLRPMAGGYRLYWAVYVVPVSWITTPYLAVIEPFRRFLLYPAILRRV